MKKSELKVGETYYTAFFEQEIDDIYIEQMSVIEIDLQANRIHYEIKRYKSQERPWHYHCPIVDNHYCETKEQAIELAIEDLQLKVNQLREKYATTKFSRKGKL